MVCCTDVALLRAAEKYLREVWPAITRALKEHGIACELNLVSAPRLKLMAKAPISPLDVHVRSSCDSNATELPANAIIAVCGIECCYRGFV